MKIQKYYGVPNAVKAKGVVVVIDILRAATTEAFAFYKGAKQILPVATAEEAFALKKENPKYLLMGENKAIKIKGFDFGNSPFEISKIDLSGKTIVHRSSQGTQGLVRAINAKELIFGSFVTGSAIVLHIQKQNPSLVSIVSTDPEDMLFADYLSDMLQEKTINKKEIVQAMRLTKGGQLFLDPGVTFLPEEDFHYSMMFDKFNFFVKVEKIGDNLVSKVVKM